MNARIFALAGLLAGCSAHKSGGGTGGSTAAAPELGTDGTRQLVVVGTAADGLAAPRDLKFDPYHPEQLWTANEGINGIVLYTNPGLPGQTSEVRVDYFARHFMDKVSSISFGQANDFASCQESHDDWNGGPQPPDNYMGPSLWLADLDIFAVVHQNDGTGEGSHIDMLHESPLCMGIAWDRANVYWAYDGYNGQIVRYDFQMDHGTGGTDHSDGIVRRYSDVTVTPLAEVASHLALDHATGMLYIADTGASRVMRLDTNSGSAPMMLSGASELLAEYSEVTGASYTKFADDLTSPSGIELNNGRLFVSDYATGNINAYALDGTRIGTLATGARGIMGITIGPDGKLWYVDRNAQTVVRVDP